MKFTLDKDIIYEQAVERMFEMLGDWKIMALASSVNDYVMVRNVSCLFYDEKIWFKTDKNFQENKTASGKSACSIVLEWSTGGRNCD